MCSSHASSLPRTDVEEFGRGGKAEASRKVSLATNATHTLACCDTGRGSMFDPRSRCGPQLVKGMFVNVRKSKNVISLARR